MAQTLIAPTLQSLSTELVALVDHAGRRIVLVHARGGRPMHGLAIARDLVVTLDHAVEREAPIRVVTSASDMHEATIAGRDAVSNLAVLRVPGLDLQPFAAADEPRPGQLVVAVARSPAGAPLASVTTIQASAVQLRGWRGALVPPVIRTDGTYPSAFAGAPLVDAAGGLVGIVPAGEWRTAGLALSAQHALTLAETLARDGVIPRAYLGVQCHGVAIPARQRPAVEETRGVLLLTVADDSPAERAGLLVGDIVVRAAGERTESPEHLHALLARVRVGTTCPVDVIRGTGRVTIDVTLGRRA